MTLYSLCFQDKVNEVRGLSEAAEALATSGDAEGGAAKERALALHQQWELVQTTVAIRIKLALSYVHFHKKAQSVSMPAEKLLGPGLNIKMLFLGVVISILKIRRTRDHLIFIMLIPVLVR